MPSAFRSTFSIFKLSKEPIPSSSPEKAILLTSDKSTVCADKRIKVASGDELNTTSPNKVRVSVAAIK